MALDCKHIWIATYRKRALVMCHVCKKVKYYHDSIDVNGKTFKAK